MSGCTIPALVVILPPFLNISKISPAITSLYTGDVFPPISILSYTNPGLPSWLTQVCQTGTPKLNAAFSQGYLSSDLKNLDY
jgi:hypothetical protein